MSEKTERQNDVARPITSGIDGFAGKSISAGCAKTAWLPPMAVERRTSFLIVADDLGWGDVGFNGRTEWSTPNLDKLAKEGRVLERCYAAGGGMRSQPRCLPDGEDNDSFGGPRQPRRFTGGGSDDRRSTQAAGLSDGRLRQVAFRAAPIRSGSSRSIPCDQGFDEFFGYTDADHAWEKFPTKLWEGRREVSVTGYIDDLITDRGLDFARRNRSRPFFLYLAYVATHFHVAAPEDEVALHKGKFVGGRCRLAAQGDLCGDGHPA